MKQWIERTRGELVTVTREFFDKPEAKNGLFGGMMKNMKADQAAVEVLTSSILTLVLALLARFVIEVRYMRINKSVKNTR